MTKCLFLLSLCLLPFLAFSSTDFTSENPIELPTASSSSSSSSPDLVLDVKGEPLQPGATYRIVSTGRGGAGGDVYLGPSPTTDKCLDGVFRYGSDVGPRGTPVVFYPNTTGSAAITEHQNVNIQFSIATTRLCVDYTVWKEGEYDESLGLSLLGTGGTIGQEDSTWFTIVKAIPGIGYRLLSCPPNPHVCPHCPPGSDICPCPPIGILCPAVDQVIQNGRRRLALMNTFGLTWDFVKV